MGPLSVPDPLSVGVEPLSTGFDPLSVGVVDPLSVGVVEPLSGVVVVVPLSVVVVVPLSVPAPVLQSTAPLTGAGVKYPSLQTRRMPPPPQRLKQRSEQPVVATQIPLALHPPASAETGKPHVRPDSQSRFEPHAPPCGTVPPASGFTDEATLLLDEQPTLVKESAAARIMALASKVFIGAQPITGGPASTCNRH